MGWRLECDSQIISIQNLLIVFCGQYRNCCVSNDNGRSDNDSIEKINLSIKRIGN